MTALSDRLDLLVDAPGAEAVAAYCAQCRYGVSVASPGICPMCRGTEWVVPDTAVEVHPF